jgi:hypothetical protein
MGLNSKEGGHIALLLFVSLSVHQHFPSIFFAEIAHNEMKFGIKINPKNI